MTKYLIEFLDGKTEEVEAGIMELGEYGTVYFRTNTMVHENGAISHSELVSLVKESEVKFIKRLDRETRATYEGVSVITDKMSIGEIQNLVEMAIKSQRGV